ncbi:MAG: HTH domain-containing protein [Arcobacter sp.]|uniref:HTH domain-containing protein n=1 Tax=Arcobacter sp. TaxID=1872629 RepID=UPI003D05ADA4
MNNNTPPYKITSKILKLSTQINEELTKLQFTGVEKINLIIKFMLEMILKSIQTALKSDQKSNYKSDQKVLLLMKENSKITIYELMEKLSMSESGIKKVIKKLKDENIISRVGSLKSGHWEIKE